MLGTDCLDKNVVENHQFTTTCSPDVSSQNISSLKLNFLIYFRFCYLKSLPHPTPNFKLLFGYLKSPALIHS